MHGLELLDAGFETSDAGAFVVLDGRGYGFVGKFEDG